MRRAGAGRTPSGGPRPTTNIDAALHGIGSASCGPGALPEHRLPARPVSFTVAFESGTAHRPGRPAP
ncbi:hypothetical protein AB0E77_30715 [Streptomyces sp. NPDC032940]|uniref:hypothetical protein n=1 Tax=Streptomyces sp. NPDC032940 TaxID=3155366 RepID=UPI0033D0FAA7